MGLFDFLEDIGGRSSSAVRMITDWKVILVFVGIAFLAFALLIVWPIVFWFIRGMR